VALLVGLLTGSRRRMLVAGMATALLPEAQPLMLGGFGEPLAAAVLVFGTFLLCSGARFFFGGVVLLSLLPLVRPNFIPLWIIAAALTWWLQSSKRFGFVFDATRRRLAVATLLFYLPTTLWILRNYAVTGAFPVVAGTSSMTFYGNYNSVSATMGPHFARWNDPAAIPLRNPNQVTSETEEFRYYDSQGKQFILRHWKIVPLLMGTHVVLSMLPDPADGAHRYSFWLARLLIYVAAIIAIRRKSVHLESWFGVMLVCSVLMTVITVVLYSGEGRYLYPQNILLIVLVLSARYKKAVATDEPRATFAKAHAVSETVHEAR
jgi:hypothetical protein